MTQGSTARSTPAWFKDVVIYQLHVKSFCDGNGDGIGDFPGLISKLDYLENLGVTALWLLPFYPSPQRDDGYDIADYRQVHPDYGSLQDFKRFLREAHARSMRVITEMVLNHTSDQHAWFQRARRAPPGSSARNFYVWSDTSERYGEARVIFQDFENSNWTWDPVAQAYFWHRFYSHQPDLNFDHPRVHRELFKAIDFWFGLGVDGMRLDAIPYLYEREGTNCENLPETYAFIKKLRRHLDEHFPDRMLLAEANQWPEDAALYFGDDDACHMCFHFPLMPRMYMALEMEDRYPVTDILEQTPEIPAGCQWALFLRNHDELTLEMVTDEERDYMYRIYARDPKARLNLGIRRRLAPLLDNDRRKIELMNVLLLTLPGSPVIYYGDEIGMGDYYYLGDRNGVRTPMQWSNDANAGFSRANPQKLFLPLVIDPEYNHTALNVATQEQRNSSLLWWMRRAIGLRNSTPSFGRGSLQFLKPDNQKVLAYVRSLGEERVCVVANLSRNAQMVALELGEFAPCVPVDMFSGNRFLEAAEAPYPICLGPYGYLVLELNPADRQTAREPGTGLARLKVSGWQQLTANREARQVLERQVLRSYLPLQRWYSGKAREIRAISIRDCIPLGQGTETTQLLLAEVDYREGSSELYLIPLARTASADETAEDLPPEAGAMARLSCGAEEGTLYEGLYSSRFGRQLFDLLAGRRRISGHHGQLLGTVSGEIARAWRRGECSLEPKLLSVEQSNSALVYGDRYFLKLYRRCAPGIHPDLEIVRRLSEESGFPHIPRYAGALKYRDNERQSVVLGLLQEYVPNQGDAWCLFLDRAKAFFEQVLTVPPGTGPPEPLPSLIKAIGSEPPAPLPELMSGLTLEMAALLGQRSAELHRALAGIADEAFQPEDLTRLRQRALFQSMQSQANLQLRRLARASAGLSPALRADAEQVIALLPAIITRMQAITGVRIAAKRIRTHGDYHLGQVLYTGSDFVIFDFEGEPLRPLSERRIKRSPLRDVAGMLRSFQYAAYTALRQDAAIRQHDCGTLAPWADLWHQQVAVAFLEGYLAAIRGSGLLPDDPDQLHSLLTPYLLEKAIYELGYELDNRPDWLEIPLHGIRQLCQG